MGAGATTCEPQKWLHRKSQAQATCFSSVHGLADTARPGTHRAHLSMESCHWHSVLGGSMASGPVPMVESLSMLVSICCRQQTWIEQLVCPSKQATERVSALTKPEEEPASGI